RVQAQRARDLDQPQLAEREAAGGLVRLFGQADALQLPRRLAEQARLLVTIEPQHRAQHARVAAQVRAERDVLEHAHVGDDVGVLERAPQSPRRDVLRRGAADRLAAEADRALVEAERAADQVERGAL